MYGLPPNENLGFLIGVRLQEIQLDPFGVQIFFDKDVRIALECRWEIDKDGSGWNGDAAKGGSKENDALKKLLDASIETYEIRAPDTLILGFSSGYALKLFDHAGYEAFNISSGSTYIVV